MTLNYDPEVWGPHYWFVIFSIAINYPKTPNNTAKKKVYDFIMNLPFFIPNDKIGNDFSKMLDEYPIDFFRKTPLFFFVADFVLLCSL